MNANLNLLPFVSQRKVTGCNCKKCWGETAALHGPHFTGSLDPSPVHLPNELLWPQTGGHGAAGRKKNDCHQAHVSHANAN